MVTAFWLDSWWFNVLICFMSFVVRNLGSKCRWLRSAPMVVICFASSCAWWQRDGDVKTRVDAGAGSVEGGGRRQGARVVVSRGGGRTRDETAVAGGSRGGLGWWARRKSRREEETMTGRNLQREMQEQLARAIGRKGFCFLALIKPYGLGSI